MDYIKFYNLENYLLGEVRNNFTKNGHLNSFDFFCIVIWKANRAKSKIAKKILKISKTDNLDTAVGLLTKDIFKEKSQENRLRILLGKWKLGLPMASAILTILYPKIYTIYDIRVCNSLKNYHKLNGKNTESKIKGYFNFLEEVKEISSKKELREKDRELWGKSFCEDLKKDLKVNFKK